VQLPWNLRWWELLPEIVVGVGLSLFPVPETSAATSAFKSNTAILLITLVAAAWMTGRILLTRYTPVARPPTRRLRGRSRRCADGRRAPRLRRHHGRGSAPGRGRRAGRDRPTGTDAHITDRSRGVAGAAHDHLVGCADPARTCAAHASAGRGAVLDDPRHRPSRQRHRRHLPAARRLTGGRARRHRHPPRPDYDIYVVPSADREDTYGGTRLDDLRGNKSTQYCPVPSGADVATGQWTVLVWCQTSTRAYAKRPSSPKPARRPPTTDATAVHHHGCCR
jgi:hypothetical protein